MKNNQEMNDAFDNNDILDSIAKGFNSSNNLPYVKKLVKVKTQDKTFEEEVDKKPGRNVSTRRCSTVSPASAILGNPSSCQ